jgi:serine/threonine-protein kinase
MGEMHPYVLGSMGSVATARLKIGDTAGAEVMYRESIHLQNDALPADHPGRANPLLGLGDVLTHTGRLREAEEVLQRALEIREASLPEGHWQVAQARARLGECMLVKGDYQAADSLLRHSFEDFVRDLPDNHYYLLNTCDLLIKLGQRSADDQLISEFTRVRDSVLQTD